MITAYGKPDGRGSSDLRKQAFDDPIADSVPQDLINAALAYRRQPRSNR